MRTEQPSLPGAVHEQVVFWPEAVVNVRSDTNRAAAVRGLLILFLSQEQFQSGGERSPPNIQAESRAITRL